MKFVCDRCQTKYSIPDERVRGKVLKVKCKTCANVITVREARSTAAGGIPVVSAGAAAAARPRTGANLALDVPAEAPAADSERTQLAHYPPDPNADPFPDLDAFAPPSPVAPKRKTGQMAPLDAADDGVQWYMALEGNRTGPFNRGKLVDKLMPLARGADVHVWNERLGDWKAPKDVPEIAADMTRRRAAPPPPPLPGAPRRPTPPPIPPLGGLGHSVPAGAPRKPTPHMPPSPIAHGPSGVGSKLPPPGGVHPALAARAEHGDPSSLLETPAPTPHMLAHASGHANNLTNLTKTNGTHAPPRAVNSDVLQMLNLPGGTETASGAPRLMSLSDVLPAQPEPRAPRKSAIYILGLLAVIGVVVVLVVTNLKKPPKPVAVVAPPITAPPEPPVAEKQPEPPPPPVAPVVDPPPPPGKGKGKGKQKVTKGQTTQQPTTTPTQPGQQGPSGDAARFGDGRNMNIKPIGPASRPPPSQSDIMKVIGNNRSSIKVCYQRALTRDNSLTHGKLAVKLSIGISGRVKHMSLDGPTQFKLLLEPCIKDVVQRWVFPQASEEYGTEFPLVFQGNE
jgi:predicted Zn finger-like uncharacterized protein